MPKVLYDALHGVMPWAILVPLAITLVVVGLLAAGVAYSNRSSTR